MAYVFWQGYNKNDTVYASLIHKSVGENTEGGVQLSCGNYMPYKGEVRRLLIESSLSSLRAKVEDLRDKDNSQGAVRICLMCFGHATTGIRRVRGVTRIRQIDKNNFTWQAKPKTGKSRAFSDSRYGNAGKAHKAAVAWLQEQAQ